MQIFDQTLFQFSTYIKLILCDNLFFGFQLDKDMVMIVSRVLGWEDKAYVISFPRTMPFSSHYVFSHYFTVFNNSITMALFRISRLLRYYLFYVDSKFRPMLDNTLMCNFSFIVFFISSTQ